MYGVFLFLHNIFRWVVLLIAVIAIYRAFSGWFQQRAWSELARKAGVFFGIALDIQLLLGFILYFVLSPFALKAFLTQGMAFVMGSSEYRFYAVEHLLIMGLAVVFAHLASILPKKVESAAAKHQRAAIFIGLAVLMILLGIPWGRPLLPSF